MNHVTYYFPLECRLWGLDEEYGGMADECERIDDRTVIFYKDAILGQIAKESGSFETPRMLAEYLNKASTLYGKVHSMTPTVEEHGGRLWGAMVMEIEGELTPGEITELKDYIVGQNADGYGESLEQHEIRVSEGDLYVSFWHNGEDYAVLTPEEFNAMLGIYQGEPAVRRRPRCPLAGADGNIFNLLGLAARSLKDAGLADAAKEMQSRVMKSDSYDNALAIIMEYVEPVGTDSHSQGCVEMRM
jgi:hypothetical protein